MLLYLTYVRAPYKLASLYFVYRLLMHVAGIMGKQDDVVAVMLLTFVSGEILMKL